MNLAVVGSGYVGLVAGACFAETGNDVICVDVDAKKIEALKQGKVPIYEPGLEELVTRNFEEGRLNFTTDLDQAVKASHVIFIAVGTPQDEDGSADLTHVIAVAKGIGRAMNGPKIVVDKSTVPVGTHKLVLEAIRSQTKHHVDVVSNPEFLKEGAALDDFMKPDRVVIGTSSEEAAKVMSDLYAPFTRTNNPIMVMDEYSAEMTKYAANTMLAARISMMNEFSLLCDKVGADIDAVRRGIGSDSRIGMAFLFPGMGYGGSCFPKDVQALIRTAHDHGVDFTMSRAIEEVNKNQKGILLDKICKFYGGKQLSGKTFAVWGLAFKPKTDDVREAPALTLCKGLLEMGAKVQAFDPEANHTFEQKFGEHPGIKYCDTNYAALNGADCLVICTEWNEFRNPNFSKVKSMLKQAVVFDGRNIYNADDMRKNGFCYFSIGRPAVGV